MELGLTGKRALVLAASRGLGYACALGLAREGCDVVMCSRDQERIEAAAAQIRQETGARVLPIAVDVSNQAAAQQLVDLAAEQFGGLEIAIHNAGGPPAGDFASISDEQWQTAFNLNLMSFVHLVHAVTPEMKKAGYGRIIAITSSSIKQPIPNLVLSNAMRTGVLGLSRTLAKELARDNILLNIIAPGRIATERIDEIDQATASRNGRTIEQVREESIAAIPLGRTGKPDELANLAVFLASEAASYITGATIQVDGGKLDALQ